MMTFPTTGGPDKMKYSAVSPFRFVAGLLNPENHEAMPRRTRKEDKIPARGNFVDLIVVLW